MQTNLGTKSVCSLVTKRSNGFGYTNLDHSRSHKIEKKKKKKRIWSIFVLVFRPHKSRPYKRIWCPDLFAPAIQNCKRILHAAQLILHLVNNIARTQIHNYLCQECGGYRQGYGQIEVHSFLRRQGPRCLRCSKLRRIGDLGDLMMTPQKSSGCGESIPELTTRRHRGRLLCLGSRAEATTLQGRHRRFAGGSAFHMSFRGFFSLLATQQKWYHYLQQVVVQSLIPHNYIQHIRWWCTHQTVCSTHTHPYCN